MVIVTLKSKQKVTDTLWTANLLVLLLLSTLVMVWVYGYFTLGDGESTSQISGTGLNLNSSLPKNEGVTTSMCPVSSIESLSALEISPAVGRRHMVEPPKGGKLTLVCCETTKGHFSALLHHQWAPIGVERLVEMIRSQYFSTKIPLFRCTDACQFGLSSDPMATKRFNRGVQDDPMWMPPGKSFRQNDKGIKRYPAGFWTFAGSGPNSRSNQMVITLKPNPYMGGGSPWEVPLGEFVGEESFALLSRLYNGYGNKGPSQKILRQEGASEHVHETWPLMDYILSCTIIDERDKTSSGY